MKNLILLLVWCIFTLSFFDSSAHAQEQRTNYYTQITIYFTMESVGKENETINMNGHIYTNAKIKQIMERTDTTMNLQQRGFGPYPLAEDPARDSILEAEGVYGKLTLAQRAWSGMNQSLQDPQNPVTQKIQEIKDLTGAQVLTIVIIVNADYYVSYSKFDHNENNTPIIVATSGDEDNYFEFYNQVIFDETSTKGIGFSKIYPKDHPLYPKKMSTLPNMGANIEIYSRKGLYQDQYGFWLQVGDDDHNVLDPDHGWKLEYLFNKGLLKY